MAACFRRAMGSAALMDSNLLQRVANFIIRLHVFLFNEHATYETNKVSEHKSLCELNT